MRIYYELNRKQLETERNDVQNVNKFHDLLR